MKKKAILPLLLCLCLLAGCGGGTAAEMSSGSAEPEPSVRTGTIAYVPLDDRPDNVERVEYLAESLGYQLEMPAADLYQTRLDGQPCNRNGTRYGDRAALFEWVLSEEARGCDLYILSVDQLLSGGLVNSRSMRGSNPVTLSDGTSLTEEQMISRLLDTLGADPDNQVWLLDTVMRLAPTMGYDGFGLDGYNALRSYGMAARPGLSGGDLTVDNIAADYPLGTDGAPVELPAGTGETVIRNYLASRERKLRLSDCLLSRVRERNASQFHFLIGIDDSSAEDSIQKNEIAYLRQNLRKGDALLSGVDDLAFKAVTRQYLNTCGWTGATACVTYYGGMEHEAACDYDYQPLTDILDEHLAFFGIDSCGNPLAANLQILVLTQPRDPAQAQTYCQALIDQLNENESRSLPTILIDAGNGKYGTAFHDALVKQSNLGWLLSYSGFLDMAIVTGTALSHGVARYAWLKYGSPDDAAANRAYLKTLSDSIVKDFCYKNTVREDLIGYVRDTLGGSPDNFDNPEINQSEVLGRLESGMKESTAAVLKNFARSNLIVSLSPYAVQGCGGLRLSGYSFPWSRVFEIRMDIRVNDLTKAHRRFLQFCVS